MRDRAFFASPAARSCAVLFSLVALVLGVPASARAQYNAPPLSNEAIGEKYHVELTGTLWNPSLVGTISSEQFGIPGDNLDLVTDLGFEQTRFGDLRLVLRPARKHRFRFQYTPISYTADTTLQREIIFNGQKFTVNLPVTADFDWKVMRLGYEYDMVYLPRGFVGVFVEGRYTNFQASLSAPSVGLEYTSAKAPLPALGVVARGYVARNVALNFDLSGFKTPASLSRYQANYFDWEISGTVNVTNNVGFQAGWRRVSTLIDIETSGEHDGGDFKFQGLWFGLAVRY
jgi:hypothetical protein